MERMNKQRHGKCKLVVRVLSVLITYHLSLIISPAQTFTQQVQQSRAGQGKVTIHQDASIDALVNGTKKSTTSAPVRQPDKVTPATKTSASTVKQTEQAKKKEQSTRQETHQAQSVRQEQAARQEAHQAQSVRQEQTARTEQPARQETHSEQPVRHETQTEKVAETRNDTTSVTPQRRMRKVTGYRIQAFVGANRQKAEQTGNALRTLFPDQPVYVSFLQPRWICRMGNFRTYAEAKAKLNDVRQMGYEAAIIVKGKISVPDI